MQIICTDLQPQSRSQVLDSQFPHFDPPADQANALRAALEKLPWWSPDPLAFPNLIEGKTTHSFATILDQSLSSNPDFVERSFLDQFTFLAIALAAVGPIANRRHLEDSASSEDIELSLTASLDTVASLWESEMIRLSLEGVATSDTQSVSTKRKLSMPQDALESTRNS